MSPSTFDAIAHIIYKAHGRGDRLIYPVIHNLLVFKKNLNTSVSLFSNNDDTYICQLCLAVSTLVLVNERSMS